MARLSTLCRYIAEFLRFCGIGDNLTDLIVLFVLALIMLHSLVTLQILPTILEANFFATELIQSSWVHDIRLSEKTIYQQYVICLFRGIQLLIGGGLTSHLASTKTSDQFVSMTIIIFGCIIRAIFMAKMLELLLRTRSHEIKHEEMMSQLAHYLSVKKFPSDTKKKFKRFYEERQMGSYFRKEKIMECLPYKLRNEVLLHNMRILLETVSFLRELPSTQFEWLIQRLEQEIILPNTEVYKFRERASYMCFITSGTMAWYSPSDVELGHFSDGDIIGIMALVMLEETHLKSVRTLETCEVYK